MLRRMNCLADSLREVVDDFVVSLWPAWAVLVVLGLAWWGVVHVVLHFVVKNW